MLRINDSRLRRRRRRRMQMDAKNGHNDPNRKKKRKEGQHNNATQHASLLSLYVFQEIYIYL